MVSKGKIEGRHLQHLEKKGLRYIASGFSKMDLRPLLSQRTGIHCRERICLVFEFNFCASMDSQCYRFDDG